MGNLIAKIRDCISEVVHLRGKEVICQLAPLTE